MYSRIEVNRWFDAGLKTKIHMLQLTLIVLAIILTGVRVSKIQGRPPARSDTLAIVMGVKSIVILSYQIITTHVEKFQKWASLRAYKILNCAEVVFWFVVVILGFMGVSAQCSGTVCALGVIVSLVAMVLTAVAVWMALISILDHRYFKAYKAHRGTPKQAHVGAGGYGNSTV